MSFDELRSRLDALGVPAPWRLHEEDVGVVIADNGAEACVVDPLTSSDDEVVTEIAAIIVAAVNAAVAKAEGRS